MSKNMYIASILIGLMIGIGFGSTNSNAGLPVVTPETPCMKKIFKDNNPVAGYLCKGYDEQFGYQENCSCFRADDPDDFVAHGPSGVDDACSQELKCACDGFADHFRSLLRFTCVGEGVSYNATAVWSRWTGPKIVGGTCVYPRIENGSPIATCTFNCRPDPDCQAACEACYSEQLP